jgi:hypothetical protein
MPIKLSEREIMLVFYDVGEMLVKHTPYIMERILPLINERNLLSEVQEYANYISRSARRRSIARAYLDEISFLLSLSYVYISKTNREEIKYFNEIYEISCQIMGVFTKVFNFKPSFFDFICDAYDQKRYMILYEND